MMTNTVTARRKGDPQHMLRGKKEERRQTTNTYPPLGFVQTTTPPLQPFALKTIVFCTQYENPFGVQNAKLECKKEMV